MPAKQLLTSLLVRITITFIIVGALLFGPAGSFLYWNGWLFLAALFVPMVVVLIYLYRRNRALLEKRLKTKEKEKEQKTYLKLSLVWFFIAFLVPGFDFRYGWSHVPVWLVTIATVIMVFGYLLFIVAMVQNSFASRVVEIQDRQRVVDSGMYSVVRHPMYLAAIIMYMACPLVLGSYYALLPNILLPVLLVYRLLNEEKVLRSGLEGYEEYSKRVRYRLVPFVW